MQDSRADKLRQIELGAIEALRTGHGTEREIGQLFAMHDLCKMMAGNGIGPEALPACDAAKAELNALDERHKKTGRYTMSGPGLQALRDLYAYHDLQRQSVSLSKYERSIQRTINHRRCQ